MRAFRFGVFAESVRSRTDLVDTARRAEDAGFDIFLIRDHFVAEPFGHQLAPLATLATVASLTERLWIGSLVFSNDYRHPVILAKEAATLDLLSEGRFELGLGAGFSKTEYEQAGFQFDPVGVRAERLAETLRILKGLFAGERFDFSGQYYTLSDLESFPTPIRCPHPPILVAGTSDRILSIVAAEADIAGFQTVSTATGAVVQDPKLRMAETVQQKIATLRQLAGPRFDQIELSTTASVVITDNRQDAAEQFARARRWDGISGDQILAMPSVFIGSIGTIIAEMQERRETYGFSYYVVHDHALANVAPIIERLTGT